MAALSVFKLASLLLYQSNPWRRGFEANGGASFKAYRAATVTNLKRRTYPDVGVSVENHHVTFRSMMRP